MIPVSKPYVSDDDIAAVIDTLRSGSISGEAQVVRDFESSFSELIGCAHGIAVANGSLALDIALESLGLQPGDEVIVPSFTIASCLFAILRAGATPVFVDVDPQTWNIEADLILASITSRTRAVLLVHTYGLAADIDPIDEVCRVRGITIIEDAAEAHGVQYRGMNCGSFGQISTFSFYANKVITCGEGGMILTNDSNVADKLRSLRNLSFLPPPQPRFVHNDLGWNARMSAMQAALGLSQLQRLEQIIAEKRSIGCKYARILSGVSGLRMQTELTEYSVNQYWVVGVVLENGLLASDVAREMRARGVDTRPFFFPLHLQPLLQKTEFVENRSLPVSEYLAQHGLYLPSFLGLTDDEIRYCAKVLLDVVFEMSLHVSSGHS